MAIPPLSRYAAQDTCDIDTATAIRLIADIRHAIGRRRYAIFSAPSTDARHFAAFRHFFGFMPLSPPC